MRIGYYNQKVEKIFLDFGKMGKKIPAEWVSQNGLKAVMARSSSPFMPPLMSD